MNELGRGSRALLDAARTGDDPAPDEKMRMRLRLAQVGVGIAVTTASATAAGGGSAVVGSAGAAKVASVAGVGAGAGSTVVVGSSIGALAAKLAVTIAIVGTVGAAGTKGVSVYRAHHPLPDAIAVSAPAPAAASRSGGPDRSMGALAPETVAAEPGPPASPAPEVAPTTASQTRPSVNPSVRPVASASTLEAETRLLRDAEALRRAGDGARALALLDEHAARFPAGVLAEERAAARVFALCDLGSVIDATSEAQRFLLERPRSPLAPRVRTSCAEARLR